MRCFARIDIRTGQQAQTLSKQPTSLGRRNARFVSEGPLRPKAVVRQRVIYGDTDQMGVVYHGTYARYLEHARVEFMRQAGIEYVEFEGFGVGLPVIDLAINYRAPARFDDVVTVWVELQFLSRTRVHFAYRLSVEAGDRVGLQAPLEVLVAQTHHGCMSIARARATRIPEHFHRAMRAQVTPG